MTDTTHKLYTILTTADKLTFCGIHRKDKETENWHYYETTEGEMLHFRKAHMVVVHERDLESYDEDAA